MKEIRFHGRGGQGVVTAAQILVETAVSMGKHAHFIPYFGVERKGSPVYGFVRMSNNSIRIKSQVYDPHYVVVFDDTLLDAVSVFAGVRKEGIVVLNSDRKLDQINLPDTVKSLVIVDATQIALNTIKKEIPNTAMLGAFAKATELIDPIVLYDKIANAFGKENAEAAQLAYKTCKVYNL